MSLLASLVESVRNDKACGPTGWGVPAAGGSLQSTQHCQRQLAPCFIPFDWQADTDLRDILWSQTVRFLIRSLPVSPRDYLCQADRRLSGPSMQGLCHPNPPRLFLRTSPGSNYDSESELLQHRKRALDADGVMLDPCRRVLAHLFLQSRRRLACWNRNGGW